MATIRKRGKTYQVQVRVKGKAESRSFGTKLEASRWALETEEKVRGGHTDEPQHKLLRTILEDYRDTVLPRRKSGEYERWIVNAFLREPWVELTPQAFSKAHLRSYVDSRLEHIQSSSLQRQLNVLRSAFRSSGIQIDLDLKLSKSSSRRVRRISSIEVERLIEATKECLNTYLLPLILFANETGMRRGEILRITWDHLLQHGLYIPEQKNGEQSVIPLTQKARGILLSLPKGHPTCFNTTASAVSQSFRRLRKRCGISDLHFHDFRHEAISRYFELGLSVPEVQSISRHRDYRSLLRYAHANPKIVLQKLEAATMK